MRGDAQYDVEPRVAAISIHSPRMRGDLELARQQAHQVEFQSTPLA